MVGDDFAKHLNRIMTNGELLNTADTIQIIKEHLDVIDISNGFVLDGFPRNIEQAKAYQSFLTEYGINQNIVIYIELSEAEARLRLNGRYICTDCGASYNITDPTLAPKIKDICDQCGSKLKHRIDDNMSSLNKRFDLYYQQTEPLVDYYENLKVPLIKLNGTWGKEMITKKIINYFEVNND